VSLVTEAVAAVNSRAFGQQFWEVAAHGMGLGGWLLRCKTVSGDALTLVGVNGTRRLPIELPIIRTERLSLARRDWVFVPDFQGGVRRWSVALAGTVRNAMSPAHQSDCHLQASLTQLEGATAAASSVTDEHGVTELYNAGRSLLARAYELRLIAEADRSSMSADLARARQCCYRLDSAETELAYGDKVMETTSISNSASVGAILLAAKLFEWRGQWPEVARLASVASSRTIASWKPTSSVRWLAACWAI